MGRRPSGVQPPLPPVPTAAAAAAAAEDDDTYEVTDTYKVTNVCSTCSLTTHEVVYVAFRDSGSAIRSDTQTPIEGCLLSRLSNRFRLWI